MKKALSILLVAAAFFGFYGSVVNLNDILACKDYWEEAGEKSTADMNKLEDGLNQLKDNEQAYLDGQDQLAAGEQALADGEAQYAQGLADYAAAPGKLAAGKAKLDAGKEQLNGLNTLIRYLNDAERKYQAWEKKYKAAQSDRKDLSEGVAPAMTELLELADAYMDETQAAQFEGAVQGLAANKTTEKAETTADYVTIMNYAAAVNGGIKTVQDTIKGGLDTATKLKNGATQANAAAAQDGGAHFMGFVNNQQYNAGLKGMSDYVFKAVYGSTGSVEAATAQQAAYDSAIADLEEEDAEYDATKAATIIAGLGYAEGALTNAYAGVTTDNIKAAQTAMKKFDDKYDSGYDKKAGRYTSDIIENQLTGADGGQGYIATVLQGVSENVLGNKTLKEGVQSKMGNQAITLLKTLANTELVFPYVAGVYNGGCSYQEFIYYMNTNPGIRSKLAAAKKMLASVRDEGQDTYDKGMADYKQGLADYAAAPGKLADAEQQLADGRKQLEDGRAQLAQYEDGEQQVRDGLATLFNTEADLDLVSIADRLNGDGDFDNGDNHLEIDEGLNAVNVGREYQSEDGVLITKEIMARAVGTGALLGAAALAVIAAILSFLKKNKGAGVFALLAAAAGAFGAYYGPAAGTYFSDIAGSTAGTAAWIAAGVVGVVALIHAIVHFAAPKTAA